MASLKNIKLKIQSYKKTGTVTHAMEAVSAVKMRKAQERALSGRAYAAAGLSVLERLSGVADLKKHHWMTEQGGRTCFIVITSDKGLAGSINSGVIKKVEHEIRERNLSKDEVVIAPIGKRGHDFFGTRGYSLLPVLPSDRKATDDITENDVMAITQIIGISRNIRDIGDCFIAYQNFISTFEQVPVIRQLLPITSELIRKMVEGIRPARGKYAPANREDSTHPATYTIEPDADTVLNVLLPRLLNMAVFHAILESKASEHSARMVAMKSATDKAKEMAHSLTRVFNKVRQAAITREVSEITSGIEAMK